MITYQEPLTFGLHMSAVGTSTALSMNTMLNNIIQMMHYQNMVIEEQNKHIWEMEESQDKAGRGRLCTPWREKHSSTLQYYRRGRSYATAKRSKPPRHSLVEKIKKVIETGTSKKAYPRRLRSSSHFDDECSTHGPFTKRIKETRFPTELEKPPQMET